MKQYATTYKVKDGPNDQGKMFDRPAKLADRFPSPYANEQEARSIHNGAYPPDLSLITLARDTQHSAPWYLHIGLMAKDIMAGFAEGGANYVFAVLTGYEDEAPSYARDGAGHLKPLEKGKKDAKAEQCASVTPGEAGKPDVCNKLQDGMNYNKAFPGHQIAMVNPFAGGDGFVKYTRGPDGQPSAPETVEQYARDVTAFLAWASDPSLEQRKRIGWQVMLYLLVTAVLLYIAKKRIWASAH
jgi:cytochrome c1